MVVIFTTWLSNHHFKYCQPDYYHCHHDHNEKNNHDHNDNKPDFVVADRVMYIPFDRLSRLPLLLLGVLNQSAFRAIVVDVGSDNQHISSSSSSSLRSSSSTTAPVLLLGVLHQSTWAVDEANPNLLLGVTIYRHHHHSHPHSSYSSSPSSSLPPSSR